EQRTTRRAENGAGRTVVAAVQFAAEQRAAGGADDQAGGAVAAAAVIATIAPTPGAGVAADRLAIIAVAAIVAIMAAVMAATAVLPALDARLDTGRRLGREGRHGGCGRRGGEQPGRSRCERRGGEELDHGFLLLQRCVHLLHPGPERKATCRSETPAKARFCDEPGEIAAQPPLAVTAPPDYG